MQAHRRTGYDLFLADLLQIVVNGILSKRRNDGVVGLFRRAGKDLLCELHDGCAVLRRIERDGRNPGRLIAGIVGLLLEILARSGVAVEGNDGAVCGALECLDLGNGCVAAVVVGSDKDDIAVIGVRGQPVTGQGCGTDVVGTGVEADDVILVPRMDDLFVVPAEIVPLQLFAYYVAKANGCAIDKPKNLAKSVTVE